MNVSDATRLFGQLSPAEMRIVRSGNHTWADQILHHRSKNNLVSKDLMKACGVDGEETFSFNEKKSILRTVKAKLEEVLEVPSIPLMFFKGYSNRGWFNGTGHEGYVDGPVVSVSVNHTLPTTATTMAHEMIHYKQFVRGSLKWHPWNVNGLIWNGKMIQTPNPNPENYEDMIRYWNLPWEHEAYSQTNSVFDSAYSELPTYHKGVLSGRPKVELDFDANNRIINVRNV